MGAGLSAKSSLRAPLVYPFMFTRISIPSEKILSAALPLHGICDKSMQCSASALILARKVVPSSGLRE